MTILTFSSNDVADWMQITVVHLERRHKWKAFKIKKNAIQLKKKRHTVFEALKSL